MELLVGERPFLSRLGLPDQSRFMFSSASQVPIETIFRSIQLAPDEPLGKWLFPFKDLFPFLVPDQKF